MDSLAKLKQPAPDAMGGSSFPAIWRRLARGVEVNWYQVAVVATTTFVIAMDVMFPPVKVEIGNGLQVYAGHSYGPLPIASEVHVDFSSLAVELLVIIAVAVAGWRAGNGRNSARGQA